jgi:DNA helicase-2/ATP-dependent DNA helicase PcrA
VPPALNAAQRRAVEHDTGPLLVLAGPGSGKTRVVTHRIARLIEKGVPPREILAVTFTNKAAREMRARARQLAPRAAAGLQVSTFHSACVRILREEVQALGYGRNFTIYDEGDQRALLRTILRDMAAQPSASPGRLLEDLGAERNRSARAAAEAALHGGEPDALVEAARQRYREELRARNAVDFDDIIDLTVRLFREAPDVLSRWQERFRHVLVDEYQDTNGPQEEVLRLLCGARTSLCVVGDDCQSIYGWRGAEVEHILTFPQRYPGTTVVTLDRNYRSTGAIVALSNAVIAGAARRHERTIVAEAGTGTPVEWLELEDEDDEADAVVGDILESVDAMGGDRVAACSRHAILLRTNEQARPFEQALRGARLPYRLLGGKSFFDRKEVLDVLAYLRLAQNRGDEAALMRVINTPARGLGAAAIQALRDEATAAGSAFWDVVASVGTGFHGVADVSPRSTDAIRSFVETLERVRAAAAARSPTLVADLLQAIEYRAEIERTYKDREVRANRWNLALEAQAAWESHLRDPGASLQSFLDALALDGQGDDQADGGRGVTVATIHAAKGLEWPVVFVAGLEDGLLPHVNALEDARSLEEERRLFYVALTRAARRLVLTRAQVRLRRGAAGRETVVSRFLEGPVMELLERQDTGAPSTGESVSGYMARLRGLARREATPP